MPKFVVTANQYNQLSDDGKAVTPRRMGEDVDITDEEAERIKGAVAPANSPAAKAAKLRAKVAETEAFGVPLSLPAGPDGDTPVGASSANSPTPGGPEGVPSAKANVKTWQTYALAHGKTEADLKHVDGSDYDRDEIAALFATQ